MRRRRGFPFRCPHNPSVFCMLLTRAALHPSCSSLEAFIARLDGEATNPQQRGFNWVIFLITPPNLSHSVIHLSVCLFSPSSPALQHNHTSIPPIHTSHHPSVHSTCTSTHPSCLHTHPFIPSIHPSICSSCRMFAGDVQETHRCCTAGCALVGNTGGGWAVGLDNLGGLFQPC